MKKGRELVESLRELIEGDVPPQFQKADNADKADKADKPDDGKGGSDQVIKALRDTDYRDKDAFFKMVQLLKGLAVNSEDDETAKKFMSKVSDALTTAAKSVLGEGMDEAKLGGSYTKEGAVEIVTDLEEMWKQVVRNMKNNARGGDPHKGIPSLKKGIQYSKDVLDRLSMETYKG